MKHYSIIVFTVMCLLHQTNTYSQTGQSDIPSTAIEPWCLEITCNKTTNLIFPYAIKSVDRGSPDLLAQKAIGAENVLQVKARKERFQQTNLTVITSDGKLHAFTVNYKDNPASLTISFSDENTVMDSLAALGSHVHIADYPLSEGVLRDDAARISQKKAFLHRSTSAGRMRLSLKGIFLKNNLMWYALKLKNTSMVDFEPSLVMFFIRDKKRSRRSATQEIEAEPVYASEGQSVPGGSTKNLAIAFKPFIVGQTKEMIIQVAEKDGGRSLVLRVPATIILKARKYESMHSIH